MTDAPNTEPGASLHRIFQAAWGDVDKRLSAWMTSDALKAVALKEAGMGLMRAAKVLEGAGLTETAKIIVAEAERAHAAADAIPEIRE